MTLPTRPHAIFSTLQCTQNPVTKPTLQRAKNANAQPTHPGCRISIIICSTIQHYILRPSLGKKTSPDEGIGEATFNNQEPSMVAGKQPN
jgi:hypothetical protein